MNPALNAKKKTLAEKKPVKRKSAIAIFNFKKKKIKQDSDMLQQVAGDTKHLGLSSHLHTCSRTK
jgi:hypothetical protein